VTHEPDAAATQEAVAAALKDAHVRS
jgi:hypothetical protein